MRQNLKFASSIQYEQVGPLLVRTPLLPFEIGMMCSPPQSHQKLFETALAIGSPSLYFAFTTKDSEEAIDKSFKYFRRMGTRPTPYGLFAGVDLATFGSDTSIRRTGEVVPKLRVDMSCLGAVISELETDRQSRRKLSYVTDPEIAIQDNRVWSNRDLTSGQQQTTHIRATEPVRYLLSLCRSNAASFQTLSESVSNAFGVASSVSDGLVDELIEEGFLISTLRFPLNTESPCDYVISYFGANSVETPPVVGALRDIQESATRNQPVSPRDYLDLMARVPGYSESDNALQIDTQMRLESARLNSKLSADLARLVRLLVQISSTKNEKLTPYLRAFEQRYQVDRVVPLLSLISDTFGLGSPYGERYVATDTTDRWSREAFLFELAQTSKGNPVELSDTDLQRLSIFDLDESTAPLSVDLFFQIVANSQSEIDDGKFELLVSPRVGDDGAGRAMGRFARLFSETGSNALSEIFECEANSADDHLIVDANYWPANARLLNIALASFQCNFSTSSGCLPSHGSTSVPLSEIEIGIESGKFFAQWSRTGQRLLFRTRNLLSRALLPDTIRFLVDVAWQDCFSLSSFNWGWCAEQMVHLPRVTFERFILASARWSIQSMVNIDQHFEETFEKAKADYQIPDLVWLAESFDDDNPLLLNLSHSSDLAILRREFKQAERDKRKLLLIEYLNTHTWHDVGTEHYVTEFVSSFVRKKLHGQPTPDRNGKRNIAVDRALYTRPPGSEWIYLRLECADVLQEEVVERFSNLLESKLFTNIVEKWFFIRYRDGCDHLRMRFNVKPSNVCSVALPALFERASDLVYSGVCSKYSVETYDREVERYGGPEALDAVESIFYCDSEIVCKYLFNSPQSNKLIAAVATVKSILESFQLFDTTGKQMLVEGFSSDDFRAVSADCRSSWTSIIAVLDADVTDRCAPNQRQIIALSQQFREAIDPYCSRLLSLAAEGKLSTPVTEICSDIVHLHCNRMFGINKHAEILVRTAVSKYLMRLSGNDARF